MTKEEFKKSDRIYKVLIFLPYFIGIVWTCLHPVVSVLTGEPKCRGWFLDENAIETRYSTQRSPATTRLPTGSTSTLCENLQQSGSSRTNIWCTSDFADTFNVAVIVPISNAVDPIDEAIVLVVPAPENDNWYSNIFHYGLLKLIHKFANPMETPWLAKTVILVSPSKHINSTNPIALEATASAFLDAYLGSKSTNLATAIPPLPPRRCQAILRNMIVVDLDDDELISSTRTSPSVPPQSDVSILSQGKRGALPNLDLVTLVGKLCKNASFLNAQTHSSSTFLAHGYTQQSKDAKERIQKDFLPHIPAPYQTKTQSWANEMVDLGYYAYTMAAGPYPPHWAALDHGIDSLTLQLSFRGAFRQDPILETLRILEDVLRALSNLHERLHHSFVLYWLPSPEKFVSHMEYFLPTILVLLPLASRAFGVMLFKGELQAMHLTMIGKSFVVSLLAMIVMGAASVTFESTSSSSSSAITPGSTGKMDTDANAWMNSCLLLLYVMVATLWRWHTAAVDMPQSTTTATVAGQDDKDETKRRHIQSLQFAACATAAYLLVPIAFCHAALVYIPALVLVPLLAFVDYSSSSSSVVFKTITKVMLLALWVLSSPPLLMVPRFFPTYTIFVKCAYVPVHLQLLLLLIS